jgi:DNA-binding protein YbaB
MSPTSAQLLAAAKQRLSHMQDLTESLARIRGTATSADGIVTAVVDSQGALVDLQLRASVSNLTPAQFNRSLVQAAAAAATQVIERHNTLIGAFNELVQD